VIYGRIALFLMTLSDLQSHSLLASLFKCDLLYSCAAVDKISTDIADLWLRNGSQ